MRYQECGRRLTDGFRTIAITQITRDTSQITRDTSQITQITHRTRVHSNPIIAEVITLPGPGAAMWSIDGAGYHYLICNDAAASSRVLQF